MNIEPLSPSIGAIIHDIDLAETLSVNLLGKLRDIWLERQVIVFRKQTLSSEQYLALANQLGTPDIYPFLEGLEDFPEITPVLKKETETVNFGGVWHSDTSYQPFPPMATMLHAIELPPLGGDTLFANQYEAYETLSDGLKKTLSDLNIICRPDKAVAMATRAERIAETGKDTTNNELIGIHPVIRTHPETGKKALYVNQAHSCHFQGWTIEESHGLLNFLYTHQIKEEFQCRHIWQEGDVAIWDNRSTLHYPVNDYHGYKRLLHRITLKGDKPV